MTPEQIAERGFKRLTVQIKNFEYKGKIISALELREPMIIDVFHAAEAAAKSDASEQVELLARLANVHRKVIEAQPISKLGEIMKWFADMKKASLEGEGLKDITESEASAESELFDEVYQEIEAREDEREFTLAIPLIDGSDIIETVTVREPSVAGLQKMMKTKNPGSMSIELVHSSTDLNKRQVSQLAQRDITKIEAWLAPFVASAMRGVSGT